MQLWELMKVLLIYKCHKEYLERYLLLFLILIYSTCAAQCAMCQKRQQFPLHVL